MPIIWGEQKWSMTRDNEGHRDYTLITLVKADSRDDGPFNVLNTPGLPVEGSAWDILGDFDGDAWCRADATVTRHDTDTPPGIWWLVEQKFSTKPGKKCSDHKVEDPLLEPQKINGNFVKYTKEGTMDKDGNPIESSSFEIFRGQSNEWDNNRPTVTIEQNVADLQLDLVTSMIDTVNDQPLWDVPARCVKLANFSWSREFHGGCYIYFKRKFEFEINVTLPEHWALAAQPGGFDRSILDEGTKVVKGHYGTAEEAELGLITGGQVGTWIIEDVGDPPAPADPTKRAQRNWQRYKDEKGENSRCLLNGAGSPIPVGDDDPGYRNVMYYQESDFTVLGISLNFNSPIP